MQLNDIQGVCQDTDGTWPVTFSLEASEVSQSYARPRVIAEAYVNCTRNQLEHTRTLDCSSFSTAAFTAAGEPPTARQPTSLTWTRTDRRDVVERIPPGEVSWVEFQDSRAAGTGTFTITDEGGNKLVITGTFDCQHPTTPARTMQRTGPMSEAEKQRCAASRPTSGLMPA